jgi:hypothetical protein
MLGSADLFTTRCKPMTSLRFLAPLLAAIVLVAGCGGDDGERASASTDATELLRSTFENLENVKSATVDLAIDVKAGDDAVNASVKGPFETQGKSKLPLFAMTVSAAVEGQNVSAGATWTGEKAYLSLLGTNYEVPGTMTREFIAAYEEAVKEQESAGKDASPLDDLGIDFSTWLKDVRNEGVVKVGDEEAVKITGTADVARVVEDLEKITDKASSLGGTPAPKLSPEEKRQAVDAVKELRIEVYSGTEDRMLRRLLLNAKLDVEGKPATIALDFKLLDVGKQQDIKAPENPRPFDELTKALGQFGLDDLTLPGLGGGAGGAGDPGDSGGGAADPKIDEYAECIENAGGDVDKARECAEILTG